MWQGNSNAEAVMFGSGTATARPVASGIDSRRAAGAGFATTADLIAETAPDEPVLCFSAASAHAIIERFMSGFSGQTTFAVKAAPLTEMIGACVAAGMTAFDVASPGEMALVRSVAPKAVLHYNNPVKSEREIAVALTTYQVRHTTVDDLAELTKLMRAVSEAGIAPGEILVSVRVASRDNAAVHDFRGKFGVDEAEAPRLLAAVAAAGFRCGLSFHPGSQCENPSAFANAIATMAGIAAKAEICPDVLNVGGGFPAGYGNSRAPVLEHYFAAIDAAFAAHFDARTRLIAEPGRAVAAPAFALLARVKHSRANGDLFLNDGIYGGLLEQTQAALHLPVRFWHAGADGMAVELRGGAEPGTTMIAARIFGPTCDPLDVLPGKLAVPSAIQTGDWIEFGLAGAYTAATTTRFNGYGDLKVVPVEDICG